MPVKPLDDYKTFPKMTHWFNPVLLAKLLNNVASSSMFGQYADRRLMVAALDTVPPEEHMRRAQELKDELDPDKSGEVWIDFVADLGDGLDSTLAVASLLARKELQLGDLKLPRGQTLIFGGDQVYPAATAEAYRNQLRQPYAWAFPDHDRKSDGGVPVYAIPGNHDWYDGLVHFLAFFCREKCWHIGGWRTRQRRSYFALQLTDDWWLWAADIQLADNLDQPQADYFAVIAKRMPAKAKIILCTAEPGWLYTDTANKSWGIMGFVIRIAMDADKDFQIPLLISGDTHHYSRYVAADGTQFITSGGGGAFLHPTHQLEPTVKITWSGERKLELAKIQPAKEGEPPQDACYPSKRTSWWLTWRNLWFAATNWDFSLLMGIVYWLAGIGITFRDQWDSYIILTLVFGAAIMGYTINQEKSRRTSVLITSALHTLAHVAAVIWFARFFAAWNEAHPVLEGEWYSVWVWLLTLLVQMGVVGFVLGSTIFGLNMLFTSLCFRMNRNDSFSSFRLGGYNNFLRIHIKGETAEVYAIGLKDVPHRDDWIDNTKSKLGPDSRRNPDEPVFVPTKPLEPHLIEKVLTSATTPL
ncbi:metallophosphoesterase [Pseudorhodoplanes sp.]|uniref:metallophosphoesterase n=1 Tax=Pseudorhodoplanes sp. TaxID=1934341 RepID=UPI003D096AAA